MKYFKIGIFLLLLFSLACSETLDFNQVEDFEHRPVIKIPLVYFALDSKDFIDQVSGAENVNPVSDVSDFRILENDYLRDNLEKIIIDIEGKNEMPRDFTVEIAFLDENGTIIYTLNPLNIPAQNEAFDFQETIEVRLNSIILNTRKTRTSVTISGAASPLIENDPRAFVLKSAGTYFIATE